jgi:hypothetical protein
MENGPFSSLSPKHHFVVKVAIMLLITTILAVAIFLGIGFQEKKQIKQMPRNNFKHPFDATNTASLKDWNRLRSVVTWYTNDTPTNTDMELLPAPIFPTTNSN